MPTFDGESCRSSADESLAHIVRQLNEQFPAADAHTVAREVARALAAVSLLGHRDDRLLLITLIARAQLQLHGSEQVTRSVRQICEAARSIDPYRTPDRQRSGAPQMVHG